MKTKDFSWDASYQWSMSVRMLPLNKLRNLIMIQERVFTRLQVFGSVSRKIVKRNILKLVSYEIFEHYRFVWSLPSRGK